MLAPALSPNCLHIVIDMQRLFAEATEWHTPALTLILPNVALLCQASGSRTVYARFITAPNPDATTGQWRPYYQRWASVTADRIDPALLGLVAPLDTLSTTGTVIDKLTFSLFGTPELDGFLQAHAIDTLIFSGVETDMCVLATVFGAVDRGLRTIIVTDAVASSDKAAHDATLTHLLPRLSEQVELTDTATMLAAFAALGLTDKGT